mmetsp:Transcript_42824/g.91416  ORF Transcript_42824/g.91416 Transcript_42824/m.91416 type:complete len:86 (-) Transcript_42824:1042-1299(-)
MAAGFFASIDEYPVLEAQQNAADEDQNVHSKEGEDQEDEDHSAYRLFTSVPRPGEEDGYDICMQANPDPVWKGAIWYWDKLSDTT